MKRMTLILIILFVLSGVWYYDLTLPEKELVKGVVTKIIDGDTLILEDNITVRLLGINTPEKGQDYYEEAKHSLEVLTLNKQVTIESQGTDKYNRLLGHVFVEGEHVNSIIVKEGQATKYYYEEDEYHDDITKAESYAQKQQLGLWSKSSQHTCVTLITLKYEESERCTGQEQVMIQNNCEKDIDVMIKDDANHIYQETLKANSLFTKNFSCIFNNAGDSIYVRDNKGLLIHSRY